MQAVVDSPQTWCRGHKLVCEIMGIEGNPSKTLCTGAVASVHLLGFPLAEWCTQARHTLKRLDLQTKASFMLLSGCPLQSENHLATEINFLPAFPMPRYSDVEPTLYIWHGSARFQSALSHQSISFASPIRLSLCSDCCWLKRYNLGVITIGLLFKSYRVSLELQTQQFSANPDQITSETLPRTIAGFVSGATSYKAIYKGSICAYVCITQTELILQA